MTDDSLIEQYLDTPDNPEEAARGERDLLPPTGTYTTVPPLMRTERVVDEGPTKGRFVARYYGEMRTVRVTRDRETGAEQTQEITTRQGFGLSHMRFNRRDRDGNDLGAPDTAYSLYLQARRAYKEAYGSDPETARDVYDFVRDYPVRVRLVQVGVPTERNPNPDREPGVMVVSLSAPREE